MKPEDSSGDRTPRDWKRPFSSPGARKGRLSGGIVALSSAAILSVYSLGRINTTSAGEQGPSDPNGAAVGAPASRTQTPESSATARGTTYKDGSFSGNGKSRHGGMEVTVVIKGGKIVSANVTSCGTRYPCSDVNPLVRSAVSSQTVPANHVSGATDSSKAYKQALTNALAKAQV